MSIKIRSFAFTEALISAAPDTTGVYALWQNGGVIYLGKASAGEATIRKALGEQFEGRKWNDLVVTRCSWEVVEDADRRHSELLHEFEAAHRCLPLWNDPQRLPT
jgi:excinuclease UvrABC nuclease subunit